MPCLIMAIVEVAEITAVGTLLLKELSRHQIVYMAIPYMKERGSHPQHIEPCQGLELLKIHVGYVEQRGSRQGDLQQIETTQSGYQQHLNRDAAWPEGCRFGLITAVIPLFCILGMSDHVHQASRPQHTLFISLARVLFMWRLYWKTCKGQVVFILLPNSCE